MYNVCYATDISPPALVFVLPDKASSCLDVCSYSSLQTVSRRSGLYVGAVHAYSESNVTIILLLIIIIVVLVIKTSHVLHAAHETSWNL